MFSERHLYTRMSVTQAAVEAQDQTCSQIWEFKEDLMETGAHIPR